MPPFLQCTDNSQYLLVVDFVVLFYQGQGLAVKCNRVLFFVSGQLLREDHSGSKIRTVGLNIEGF